jgi:hypothetical protein
VSEISGQTIKDMMEMTLMIWPAENGAFPHISGITFSVNTSIPSSVVLDENEMFVSVSGEYRVYDLKIYNKETDKYEPIDLNKTYKIAASNHYLLEYGSGLKMLENTKVIQNDGILDVEVLERYINEMLGGIVGEEYAEAKPNITFTDGVMGPTDDDVKDPADDVTNPTDDEEPEVWIAVVGIAGGIVVVVAVAFVVIKINKKKQENN